ncbi:MAG: RlmE family RNA methyltransferase [Thermoplasmata archaeon]
MGNWSLKKRHDFYWKMAKKEHYRSRASYKLKMIIERYGLLGDNNSILDLGCSPGGWLQILKEYSDDNSFIVGIDLKPIEPIEGVYFIRGDISKSETQQKLEALMEEKKVYGFNLITSDMSPNISGVWNYDHARSVELVEVAIKMADKYLMERGNFVAKLFKGDIENRILSLLRKKFFRVYEYKPMASRKESAETYLVCMGKKIDKSNSAHTNIESLNN